MAGQKYRPGQKVYLITNGIYIREAEIVRHTSGFYTIRWSDSGGGTRVRESRLYASPEEVEKARNKARK